MDWVHEFTLAAMFDPALPIGPGPLGTRVFYEAKGGEIVGDRLRGRVLGGGEWALVGPDGYIRIDVRLQVETHDGAHLYVQYEGLLEVNETVQSALDSRGGTDFADQAFFANLRIETGDERYAWLNTAFLVGEGRILPDLGVEYRVWRPA